VSRVLLWGSVTVTACLCCFGVNNFSVTLSEYRRLQKDASRQLNMIGELQNGQGGQTQNPAILSSSETVNQFSSQIAAFELLRQAIHSEKNGDILSGWEEWRIEAICTGSLNSIYAFIDALENQNTYHALDFSIDTKSGGQYDLNLSLRFYAPHE
jgi:hypothetical protein